MDYLALLCTIHGDGPQTLLRLRRRGYSTLGDVVGLPARDLEIVLGRERLDAERFQREAMHLRSRVEGHGAPGAVEGVTRDAGPTAPGAGSLPPQSAIPEPDLPGSKFPEPAIPPLLDLPEEPVQSVAPQVADSPNPATPRSPVDVLIQALDQQVDQQADQQLDPDSDSRAVQPAAAVVQDQVESSAEPRLQANSGATPLPSSSPTGTDPGPGEQNGRTEAPGQAWSSGPHAAALGPGTGTPLATLSSDRVGHEMIAKLEARGFRFLEDLVAPDARRGAQRAGLAYTQMLRLQFLARRALRLRG